MAETHHPELCNAHFQNSCCKAPFLCAKGVEARRSHSSIAGRGAESTYNHEVRVDSTMGRRPKL
eukprot:13689625-Alexandrium_andersonii.AAC.1